MSRRRQLVLSRPGPDAALEPLGSIRQVREILGAYNTAADGSPERSGMLILHGPGMVVEVPTFQEPVTQAMISVKEEDMAFCVLWRLCRKHGWKMTDPESGQTFG